MKKQSMIMRAAALMCAVALVLSMTATAFAAKTDSTNDSVNGDSVTTDVDKTSKDKTEDTDSRYNVGLETEKPDATENPKSTAAPEDESVQATEEPTADPTIEPTDAAESAEPSDSSANLSTSASNDNAETVKTGEKDMMPVIIGLGFIAVIAIGGYVVYTKKKE